MKRLLIPGISLAALLLSGCGESALALLSGSEETGNAYLYYLNDEENQLVSYGYSFEDPDMNARILEVLALQAQDAPNETMHTLLPDSVTVQSYEVENELLTLDLSAEFADLPVQQEILIYAGFVKTFTQLDEISEVLLTIDGKPIRDSEGNEIDALDPDDFME